MIIVTANVGLLPSEIAEKNLYHREEGRFFLGTQLNLRRFHHRGTIEELNLPG
jgi:hypothetical protein